MLAALVLEEFPLVLCGIAAGVCFAILPGLVTLRGCADDLAVRCGAAPAEFAALVLVDNCLAVSHFTSLLLVRP